MSGFQYILKRINFSFKLFHKNCKLHLKTYRNLASYTVLRQDAVNGMEMGSCLYMPGDIQLKHNFAVMNPEIDFISRLGDSKNVMKLKANISARRMKDVDFEFLFEGFKSLEEFQNTLECLKSEREVFNQQLEKCMNSKDKGEMFENAKKLKSHVAKKIDEVRAKIYELEHKVIIPALHLPNSLHENTPTDQEIRVITHGHKSPFSFKCDSHINICKNLEIIKLKNVGPNSIYYLGIAAELEQVLSAYFSGKLQEIGFKQIFSPHFCKSVIVEGTRVCDTFDVNKRIFIEDIKKTADINKYQLVGGSSTESLIGMLSKILIDYTSTPVLNFCYMRNYRGFGKREVTDGEEESLFSAIQSNRLHFLCAGTADDVGSYNSLILEMLLKCYESLELPFKVAYLPASKLLPSESLKISMSIWSPFEKRFIEVAWISIFDDFISERLLMKYINPKGKYFLHVLSGCAMDFPKLLGLIAENNQTREGNFHIPKVLKPYFKTNSQKILFTS